MPVYYTSESYYDFDFDGDGWYSLRFGFEEVWYLFDGTTFQPVDLTPQILSDVVEIGFRFFPRPGTTAVLYSAIDDVKLEPLVTAPPLEVSADATDFLLAFTPAKANWCLIEKLETGPTPSWQEVTGQIGITGPGEHVFRTPLAGRGIYRVQSFADYTPVVTPAPAP